MFESNDDSVKYQYSLDDKDSNSSYSISAISCCRSNDLVTIACGSNEQLKVWTLNCGEKSLPTDKHQVALLKMSSDVRSVSRDSDEESDEDEESENEQTESKKTARDHVARLRLLQHQSRGLHHV